MQNPAGLAVISDDVLEALVVLCRRHRVRELALFGSAAGADFDPGRSDIDLLVAFEPMPPTEHMQHYFDLHEALKALFGRRVDQVEPAAVRNPYVLRSILKSRVPLYAAA